MQVLAHIYRAWVAVEADGNLPRLPVPTYAKPSKTKLGDTLLTVELNPCPERDAILKGKRFEASSNTFVGMFEAIAGTSPTPLRPSGSGYSLDATDLETAGIVAYAVPQSQGKSQVTASEVQIGTGPNSLEIIPDTGKGAKVRCSSDLQGQAIRVRVLYGGAIVLKDEPIKSLEANLVGLTPDDRIVWVKLPGCIPTAIARTLTLQFDPAKAHHEVLV